MKRLADFVGRPRASGVFFSFFLQRVCRVFFRREGEDGLADKEQNDLDGVWELVFDIKGGGSCFKG